MEVDNPGQTPSAGDKSESTSTQKQWAQGGEAVGGVASKAGPTKRAWAETVTAGGGRRGRGGRPKFIPGPSHKVSAHGNRAQITNCDPL